MPIKDKSKYPPNWKDITAFQRLRAGDKCELCGAAQHQPHPVTGSRVVLTVHHIERGIGEGEHEYPNLIVLCQRCHLRLDLRRHMRNGKLTRERKKWYTGKTYKHGGKVYEVAELHRDYRLQKGDVVMVAYRDVDSYAKELAEGRIVTLSEDEDEGGNVSLGILTRFDGIPCYFNACREDLKLMREVTQKGVEQ